MPNKDKAMQSKTAQNRKSQETWREVHTGEKADSWLGLVVNTTFFTVYEAGRRLVLSAAAIEARTGPIP